MTRKHFIDAAEIVRNILGGVWALDSPSWATDVDIPVYDHESELSARYLRAVWTAEAFIVLFREHNPRFDESRFLIACGLQAKAPKVEVKRA